MPRVASGSLVCEALPTFAKLTCPVWNLDCFRELDDVIEAGIAAASLNVAYVVAVEPRQFGETGL